MGSTDKKINRTESRPPHPHWQQTYDKGAKAIHWRKDSFQQMVLKYLDIHMQRKYTSIYTSYPIKKLLQNVSDLKVKLKL